jgi:3-oxoacyl-[acyl-carrier protein] reductase
MLFSLEGYKALITGASGAIGRAISIMFASQGAEIAISGTRSDALEELAETIRNQTGKVPVQLLCNLSNQSETLDLVQRCEAQLGPIDVLVNNAGINRDMLFSKMTMEDFELVDNVNLKAAFILMKSAISSMKSRKYGRIINMSSVVGLTGNIGQANYCASKAGIIGLSKAVALEYAKRNITINCVAPGAIRSPMIEKLSEQAQDRFIAKIPMGRLGEPEDVACLCGFLASKEASYITGQTFHVNGGLLMQ